jgi:uncharacterized protein
LKYADTYYTRPMSEGWSKLRDIDLLADGKSEFELVVPLERMARVPPEFRRPGNEVRADLAFGRELNRVVARVGLSGTLGVICQRCMSPMQWPLETRSSAVLIGSENEANQMPVGTEAVLASERKIRLIDLIEEELLLALPLVPLHKLGSASHSGRDEAAQPVQRPFEQLSELLKRHQ